LAWPGLGCSALLPLTISFGQERLTVMSASVASGVIASYQLGYGLAAFGVGPLRDSGLSLAEMYAASGRGRHARVLSFAIALHRPSPSSLHPRPAGHRGSRPTTSQRANVTTSFTDDEL